jgi:hypothetical protein
MIAPLARAAAIAAAILVRRFVAMLIPIFWGQPTWLCHHIADRAM